MTNHQTHPTDLSADSPKEEGDSSPKNNYIDHLLDEGFHEQRQRRRHRGAAVWVFGTLSIILIVSTLIPLEMFIYYTVFMTGRVSKYVDLFHDKLYFFIATAILMCSAIPLTIAVSIIRMISSNKSSNNKEKDDEKHDNISVGMSPILELVKTLTLALSTSRKI